MIRFSNGHEGEYFVASGALAFDGNGWPWEWPLRWMGLIDPGLFTVGMKSVTFELRAGNLRWWKPWECVRFIKDGSVNKVGLTNGGIKWWCTTIGPTVSSKEIAIAGSIFGTPEELVAMAKMLNPFDLVLLELNFSCPNADHAEESERIIQGVRDVCAASKFPIIAKLSVAQDYLRIARGIVGYAEAISFNSVPWEMIFPGVRSPLWKLEQRVGGGGGGVSGKVAQPWIWLAVEQVVHRVPGIPVIAPSIWSYGDIQRVRNLGAQAVSFGAIHLRTPWRPTAYVHRDIHERTICQMKEREYASE